MTITKIFFLAVAATAIRFGGKTYEAGDEISFGEADEAVARELFEKGAIKPVDGMFSDPIVATFDTNLTPPLPPLLVEPTEKMTVVQLTAMAAEETVIIGDGFTKAEIIAAILAKREADNPGPRQEGLE